MTGDKSNNNTTTGLSSTVAVSTFSEPEMIHERHSPYHQCRRDIKISSRNGLHCQKPWLLAITYLAFGP